jgi:hypothetical protein
MNNTALHVEVIEELNRLVTQAKATINPLTANKLAKQAEEIMILHMPNIIISLIKDVDALKAKAAQHE